MSEGQGGNDVLTGGTSAYVNQLYGDAYAMSGSKGGNDVLTGGADTFANLILGDAYAMLSSLGGNDVLTGGASTFANNLFADAFEIYHSQGGNDVLTGGVNSELNSLYGDAFDMYDSVGGNDVLTGGASSDKNFLYGDAYGMSGGQGGNDVLTGDANSHVNELYGDALAMSGSRGGNDILIASFSTSPSNLVTQNTLYGDAKYHFGENVICGNDRLISGTGNDDMWGDIAFSYDQGSSIDLTRVTTGHDIFVFSANNGNDTIHDFRQGEDKIELQGVGVASFDALMAGSHLSQDSANSVITFGTNTITVVGVTELTAADFMFT
jgi:Ca2+-binding RTX toxin-like protein